MKLTPTLALTLTLGSLTLIGGCSDGSDEAETSADNTETTTQSDTSGTSADPHAGLNISLKDNQGRVLEAVDGGEYTFAQVDQNGENFWIAGQKAGVGTGDILTWNARKRMENFHSKALDRRFEEIFFVSGLSINQTSTRIQNQPQQAQAQVTNRGQVLEVQTSGGYSYLKVDTGQGQTWLASPRDTRLEKGSQVGWSGGAVMRNFAAESLGRTFDRILFVGSVTPLANAGSSPATAATAGGGTQGEVLNVEDAGGYSYLQVQTSQGPIWLAAPQAQIAPGDRVSWTGATTMTNFNSPSLGRTFDRILFAGSITQLP